MSSGSSIWLSVLSLLVGFFAAGIPVEAYRRHRDRQATAAILAAEIASIRTFIEKRDTIAQFSEILKIVDTGVDFTIPKAHYAEPEYGPILEKQIDKLGLLPPELAGRVVSFYGHLISVRALIKNLVIGALNVPSDTPAERLEQAKNAAATRKARSIRLGIEIWNEANANGDQLIADLLDVADENWLYHVYVICRKLLHSRDARV